jgi:positive regulator of sigma E activity
MTNICGIVISKNDDLIEARLKKQDHICQNCHAHGLCGITYRNRYIKAKDECQAQVNDRVLIEVNPANPIKLSFIFYIMPLAVFFTVFFLTSGITEKIALIFAASLSSILFLYVILFFLSRKRSVFEQFLPKAIRILNQEKGK